MSNLDMLIEQAEQAYMEIEIAYQQADINEKIDILPKVQVAQRKLTSLQSEKLDQLVTITDDDLAEMTKLRDKINQASDLQTTLMTLIGFLGKFLT
ncbi:hypothetical protein LPB41_03755 [Thalassospira sp. MA62]|nr:hypothetical protein [Thalassospira sp. MA62]